jgi:hypothetical protein
MGNLPPVPSLMAAPRSLPRVPTDLLGEIWKTQTLPPVQEQQFQRDMIFAPGWRDWRRDFMRNVGGPPNTDPGGDYNYRLAWASGTDPGFHEPSNSYHGLSTAEMPPPFAPAPLKAGDHPTAWKEGFMNAFGFDPDTVPVDQWSALVSPAEERRPYPSEDAYFQANPNVGGMAAEDGRVVLNPYAPLSEDERRLVAANEAARLRMRSDSVGRPDFELTPEQAAYFASINNGRSYGSDQDIRETIIGRILSGDPSAGTTTPEQRAYARRISDPLEYAQQALYDATYRAPLDRR